MATTDLVADLAEGEIAADDFQTIRRLADAREILFELDSAGAVNVNRNAAINLGVMLALAEHAAGRYRNGRAKAQVGALRQALTRNLSVFGVKLNVRKLKRLAKKYGKPATQATVTAVASVWLPPPAAQAVGETAGALIDTTVLNPKGT